MDAQPIPETMIAAVRQFQDPQVAHDFFAQVRFPNGVACPRMGCGSANVAYLKNARRWYCNDCKRQSSVKVGTIFEDSPIGMDKWLPAIWLLSSNRNGVSSCELARALKVTQKTAWFMLMRIRTAFASGTYEKLSGAVEADETYIGGYTRGIQRPDGTRKARGPRAGKAIVMGIVERNGAIRAFVIPSTQGRTVQDKVREHVEEGATLYTDGLHGYKGLKASYTHHIIDHAYEYVRGHVHTNSIESFWSVFKRTIKGTYIAPRPQHLQRYVNEQVFRFNEREETDGPRFAKAVKQADGKRLTYNALTGRRGK